MPINVNEGFPVLYSDCPWDYSNDQDHKSDRGGTPYEQMTLDDLCAMRPLIDKVTAKNCILFQWTTLPKIIEGLTLMEAWGFHYTTTAFVWVKLNAKGKVLQPETNMVVMNTPDKNDGFVLTPKDVVLKGGVRSGQGYYTNANAEIVLLGKRGRASQLRTVKSVKQVVFAEDFSYEGETIITPVQAHSAKPEEVRERINVLTGGIPALELFARPPARVPGWVKLGWEIDNEDIRVMLQRLIDGEYSRPKDGK
jgi:N6-adenosine-specific RNA methylase IME4